MHPFIYNIAIPMLNLLNDYLTFLFKTFMYDMDVFSKAWMYYWLLVPATAYVFFFFIKWTVITAPIWLPIRKIFTGLVSITKFIGKIISKAKEK